MCYIVIITEHRKLLNLVDLLYNCCAFQVVLLYKDVDMALTDAQIRGFKPEDRRIRKSDSAGLFIEVMPSGGKYFRLAGRLNGKQRTYLIGEYPTTKLADARLKAAEYKRSLKEGIDPNSVQKKNQTLNNSQGPFWQDCQ